jgi:hypothetical protein
MVIAKVRAHLARTSHTKLVKSLNPHVEVKYW